MRQLMGLLCVGMVSLTCAADNSADAMQKLLFAGAPGFSAGFQQGVVTQLMQRQWQVQEGAFAKDKCGKVPHKAEKLDLNQDGDPELMLLLGNECSSGKVGQTVYLFSGDGKGGAQRHLGFSASGYKAFKREGEAWPDLLFEGTGDCQPVWRYKGGRYAFNHLYESKKGGCYVPQSDTFGG